MSESNIYKLKNTDFLRGALLVAGVFFSFGAYAQGLPVGDSASSDEFAPPGLPVMPGNFEFDEQNLDLEGGSGANTAGGTEDAMRSEAFRAALEGLLPLRPEEIRALFELFDRTQDSVELPVYPNPKPEIAIENINLDPGAPPSVIKMAYGHVTTISFLDSSGQPWPIHSMSWAGNFQIVETEAAEEDVDTRYSNSIIISPQSEFAYGNISIKLLGLQTPVIMTLETSRDVVYYRFDAIMPDYGPLAEAPIIDASGAYAGGGSGGLSGLAAGNSGLSSALEGIVPTGAQKLAVSGVDGRTSAFSYNGMTYVRTPLTLLSPGWSGSVSSLDGMKVYEISGSPVLLLSDRGQVVRARLSNREDVLDER
ncbi:MAG: DotH/IcmK family type IV secretion protein [Micavibrio sp.]|nr:DotH/IcmK family type IV secretion protein [Micavibrio sp.]